MRSILSCGFLALLGGCASGEWVKTSGELASEPVLAQCSQQAAARAKTGQSTPQADGQEQTLFNLCMKQQGYDYIPITPGSFR